MFAEAIERASQFTFPVIISNKYQDGSITSSLGSFIIINEEGWFITAAHIVQQTFLHQAHVKEYNDYVKGNSMVINPKWILNHSLWFAADHHRVSKFHVFPDNDLAIGQIENFDPAFVKVYPQFVRQENIKVGRSVCKLGFPFYDIQATFSENTFRYAPNLFPIPRFPYEGMITRIISGGKRKSDNKDILWLETSSPGLRGQSGGPIFDNKGTLWAMQSMTRHIPLGFSPTIQKNGVSIEENQFINLGWGVHVNVILDALNQYNVKYYLEPEFL